MKKNIDLVKRLFQEQASRDDTSLYEELFAETVTLYGPASGQVVKGRAALKRVDQGYHRAYPGAKFELEEIFAHGDAVTVRWTCHASFKEGHKGITPKKKSFRIWGMSHYRISQGKIVEIRQFWDRLGILEQIGEIHLSTDPVQPGYYKDLLKSLGMENYAEPLLSKRERECLDLLLKGKTAKETAMLLRLSSRTIETYLDNLKRKLKCSNKGQLFTIAETLRKLELL